METGQSTSPKYCYIMNVFNGTITHGPLKDDSPKNIEVAKEVGEKNRGRAKIRARHIK